MLPLSDHNGSWRIINDGKDDETDDDETAETTKNR